MEDKQARRADAKALLDRDEGATRAELLKVLGEREEDGVESMTLKSLLKKAHLQPRGDRYRSREWEVSADQTSLLSTDEMT
jgi:hypothetical protein